MKKFSIFAILAASCFTATIAEADNLGQWGPDSDWVIPNEYVVDFEDDVDEDEIKSTLSSVSYHDTELAEDTKIEIVTIDSGHQGLLNSLKTNSHVEHVEPLTIMRALWVPNDPLYEKQWHLTRVGAESAWQFGIARGVTVAVIDTGIACENFQGFHKATDLNDTKCVEGHDFVNHGGKANDEHGHGTHVAGTIAQSTNNGLGTAGLAFGAWLMPIKVLDANGSGTNAAVSDGIRWAADHGAQVINMSLGSPHNSAIMQDAIDHATDLGVIVVAAAGNSSGPVGYPGASDGVIGVSASDQNDGLAWFSCFGKGVDISAPGVEVTQQTICDQGKDKCEIFSAFNGTSMASPHVAAAAAMLVGMGVTNPDAIEDALYNSAKTVDSSKDGNAKFGHGILQVDAAMRYVYLRQLFARLLGLLVAAFAAFKWASTRGLTISVKSKGFWALGLATSVGLAWFSPWLVSHNQLWIELLSRPIADWDLAVGATVHKFLPLANALFPLGLIALFYKLKSSAGFLAGSAVGTAGYLAATIGLGQLATPFGWLVTTAWCGLNIVGCLYMASLLLVERPKA